MHETLAGSPQPRQQSQITLHGGCNSLRNLIADAEIRPTQFTRARRGGLRPQISRHSVIDGSQVEPRNVTSLDQRKSRLAVASLEMVDGHATSIHHRRENPHHIVRLRAHQFALSVNNQQLCQRKNLDLSWIAYSLFYEMRPTVSKSRKALAGN